MSLPLGAVLPFFKQSGTVETDLLTATLTPANISGQGSNERGYNEPSSNGALSADSFTFDGTAFTVDGVIARGGTRGYSDILILIVKDGVTASWPKGDLDGVWFDPGINELEAVNLGTVVGDAYTTAVDDGGDGYTWWESANNRRGFGVHLVRPRVDANVYLTNDTYDIRLFTKT